jgi:hypothetical protein
MTSQENASSMSHYEDRLLVDEAEAKAYSM